MIQIVANKLPDPPLYNRPAHPDCHLQILFYWTVLFAICRPFSLSGSFATGWPMWYDIPLHCCFMSAATFCKKKCDHCNPLNQHVDQSLATRCVFSPFVQQWVSGPRWGRSLVVIADILFCNIIWSVVDSFDFRWSWIDSRIGASDICQVHACKKGIKKCVNISYGYEFH